MEWEWLNTSGRENVNQTVIQWLPKRYTFPVSCILRITVLTPEWSFSSPIFLCSQLYTKDLYLMPPLTIVRPLSILYWYFSSLEAAQRCLNQQGWHKKLLNTCIWTHVQEQQKISTYTPLWDGCLTAWPVEPASDCLGKTTAPLAGFIYLSIFNSSTHLAC